MKINLLILFLIACILCPLTGKGQQINFDHFTVENGLSQNSVLSIVQDKQGFMWLGTRYGLNKFDTQTFKVYKNNPVNGSLSSCNYLRSLLVDKHNNLWIGSSYGLNKYNRDGDSFIQIMNTKAQNSISANLVNFLFEDKTGRIWVATSNGLNLLTDSTRYTFKRFFYNANPIAGTEIYTITEDSNGTLWLGTSNGLISFNYKNGTVRSKIYANVNFLLNSYPDNSITALTIGSNYQLWIGTKKAGLIRLDISSDKITSYVHDNTNPTSISSNNIRKMLVNKNGKIWIGTLNGINIYDPENDQFSLYQHDPDNAGSLSQNSVYDIYQDRQGNVWVGTYYGGLDVVYPNSTAFNVYQNSRHRNSISSNIVSAIIEDKKNNLWIGTEAEGLNFLDRQTGIFKVFRNNGKDATSISSNLVKTILQDKKGNIWIGTHQGGLNLYNEQTKTFRSFVHDQKIRTSISSNDISSLLEDRKGRFWVGTNKGLNLFDSRVGEFKIIPLTNQRRSENTIISCLFEDDKQNIWVGAVDGLYLLKYGTTQFRFINGTNINSIYQDKLSNIWLGTYHKGLGLYNPTSHVFKFYTETDGLPGNNVLGILGDDHDNLWISTDNGLANYDYKTFKNYNIKDGLPSNEFNYNSFFKDSHGELFFGSYAGLVSFFPEQIAQNRYAPTVVFTGLKLFNKTLGIGTDSILKKDISVTKQVTFKHWQNVITINFVVLNFIKANKNKYAYKLDGFERSWNYVNIPTATYTNLSPGKYTLWVKGTNNDGVWSSPAELHFTILPPLWQTWWAYLSYALFVAGILFIFMRFLIIRALLKKEQEVHQMKLNFFTNISHELRTPLTLISGPLEKILDDHSGDDSIKAQITPVKNNVDRLMRLITELLDFRKAETGNLRLQVSTGNIVAFTYEIYLAFQNIAFSRHIDYSFTSESQNISLYFDKEQLEKVLFNLLSNAFKFTPDNGVIGVNINAIADEIYISVSDNGKGIPYQSQNKIFTNFYQAENTEATHIGSGIGLAFSKSIIELHSGNITFTSEPALNEKNGSTCFRVSLKTGKNHFAKSDFITNYLGSESPVHYQVNENSNLALDDLKEGTIQLEQNTILLAEDNAEVRAFIKSALEKRYNIIECADGAEGWQTATVLIPDLIISDVMMPVMDGFELCRNLKLDTRTSHIPVILLTARAAYIHQLEGLETGADAYITKPFSLKLLELNIRNLLTARNVMRQKFTQVVSLQPQNIAINTTDQIFITKVLRYIEEHLTNSEFGVPMLASEIGMSQPVLYKKIRALTDLSVNDFIKSIRLKKAAQLLEQRQLTIYEIAYSVGFNDRKYFSQEFKKYFGKTPTDYLDDMQAKTS